MGHRPWIGTIGETKVMGWPFRLQLRFNTCRRCAFTKMAFVCFTGSADLKRQIDYPYEVNGVAEHE